MKTVTILVRTCKYYYGVECMDDKRRKIILAEIRSWKKHKLLPEHYCDFLTALYTEGSDNYQQISNRSAYPLKSKTSFFKRNAAYILFSFVLILAVSFIIFLGYYFSDFSLQLQLGIVCLLICFAGVLFRWFFVQFLSLFALMIILAWSTLAYVEEHFSWILFEGSWLVIGLLFLGIAWFTRTVHIQLSLNLFIHGLLFMFVPEIQGMFISSVSKEILLLFLFSKLIFVSLFLFINKRILDVYINVFST